MHVFVLKIMETNKLLITFVIAKSRMNKSGYCPLRCRITYKGEKYEFSTGEFVKPDCWNSKHQTAKPLVQENQKINTALSLIKNKINQAYLLLVHSNVDFSLDEIVTYLKPQPKVEEKQIISFFDEYIIELRKRIGYDYKLPTIWKYEQSRNLLADYLRSIRKKDYPVKDLDLNFITKYELFLKVDKKLAVATVYKTIQRLKKVTTVALQRELINKDPFISYKFTRPKTEVQFLTQDDLNLLSERSLNQRRLEDVRKMFLFCCYTGLAYSEMENLKWEHISPGSTDMTFISMIREKTSKKLFIPLMDVPVEILDYYKSEESEFVFPRLSNQKFNSYLKEVADIVGIEKRVTHHMARKTFATTVLLYNDVPMEIVSEILGHSSISITQEHYAKVQQSKVLDHLQHLNKKLSN